MSSLEYLLQHMNYVVMSRYPYIKWICLDVQYTIQMCLKRSILSDSKPIGTLMNCSTQLWLNTNQLWSWIELTYWIVESWEWPKVLNLICWISWINYPWNTELYHKYRSTMSTPWLTKCALGKVGVCSNIKFTRLAYDKSLYMVIIGSKSHEDLTKCETKLAWIMFNHYSKSLVYHISWKSYLVIIGPNAHEKLTKIVII